MQYTSTEVKEAILTLAKEVNAEDAYKALLDENIGYPSLVKNIVFDLFLKQISIEHASTGVDTAYAIIFAYAIELHTNGFVKFKD